MQLIKYDAACRAIAEAKAVDEVKDIRDRSEALKQYARLSKNRQLEIDAAEIRIRAERRLGQMMSEQREAGMLSPGRPAINGSPDNPINSLPTLAQAGIDKNLADRARKLAAVPEQEFESTLADHRAEQAAVTAKTMTRLAKQGETNQKEKNPALSDLVAAWKAADLAARRAFLIFIGAMVDEGDLDVWKWYATAYEKRYGAVPVRNAKVNSQLSQLISRIGGDAPYVAQFYVSHNQRFYVEKGHPVGLLLNDAEKLRTEWATSTRITDTAARQADQTQAQGDVWTKLIAEAEEAKANGH